MLNYDWRQIMSDVVVASIITGIFALVVGFVSAFLTVRGQNGKKLDDLSHDYAKLIGEHAGLKEEHESLSKQHKELSVEHKTLKTEINNHVSDKVSLIKENQNRIEQTVTYLKDSQLRSEGEKRLLTEKALDISKTIDQLSALNDLLIKQCARIQKLERENQALKRQLEHNQEWEEEQEF